MFKNALKYYKFGKYHAEKMKFEYGKIIGSMNLTKNDELSVVDIGSGSGRLLHEVLIPLLPKNIKEIVATDIDEKMIDFSRSVNEHPKVIFNVLDIGGEKIPLHFQNRFDLLFSSYCFQYVRDLGRAFSNCEKLLKPNGELALIFQCKTNALYSTYKKMSRIDEWKLYMKEYANFVPCFSDPDPDSELRNITENAGLTLINYNFDPEFYITIPRKQLLGIYQSLDNIKLAAVPKDQQEDYNRDFVRSIAEEIDLRFSNGRIIDEPINFQVPTVIIHAKKNK
ncbi:juvenile hormone acid O-methyltransferase-like [Harmonia axyridis]|uniref:juvenile hormone acid O-methyltransferase-like n=1 Tax=Harmonia axyridis TaxID=115357 RepID=UPI001E279C2D|nr:juvenile hormone acid O-methyltransferase-like [Harmonia axyridis]